MSAPQFGLLTYPGTTVNLGDAIQSLAALRFLPRVDVEIEREWISSAPAIDGSIKTILNGWYMHHPRHWPPHPRIDPLPIAMHFSEPGISRLRRWVRTPIDRMLSKAGGDWLRRHGPIGARDQWTFEQLERRGIPAWFSGCLTLTLRRPMPRDGAAIIACDLSPKALYNLRRQTAEPIRPVTHVAGAGLDRPAQAEAAERLLALYAAAPAVVTSRIHAALPCLALGTPVLLVHPQRPSRRVGDMAKFMHSCTDEDFAAGRHEFDFASPPANPEDFRTLVGPLIRRCRAFTGYDAEAPAR